MYTVKFTNAYKKSYKLMKKRGLDLSIHYVKVSNSTQNIGIMDVDTGSHSDILKI